MCFHKRKGFTLLELMIVVIIIGILASLAIPRFIVARDRAIMAEAFNMLGAIRGSQMRYYLEHDNDYHMDPNLATAPNELDVTVDPGSIYFTYSGAKEAAGTTYIGAATGIGAMVNHYVWIEEDGDIGDSETTLP